MWSAAPGDDWPTLLAQAAGAAAAGGRGALICVPDNKDARRVDAALTDGARAGPPRRAHQRGRAGRPLPRLPAVARGARRVVVGTRARRVRAGPRPRPGRDLGRRRRPVRRAAGALPAHPRDAADAGRARARGGAGRRLRAQRRGGVPPAHGLGPGDRPDREALRERVTVGVSGATEQARSGTPTPPGSRGRCTRRSPRRCGRAGAGADPAGGLCARAGLRPLPHPRTLSDLRRAAGADRTDHATGVPLVRHRRRSVGVSRVRRPRAAGAGARRRTHRRGAGPGVPQDPGPDLGAATGSSPMSTATRRSWWRRPGPSRWPTAATPPSCCSTPGCCSPGPTCGRPRRRCAAGATRRAGPARRHGARGRRPGRAGAPGAGALGPRRLRRARDRRAPGGAPAAGSPARHDHR